MAKRVTSNPVHRVLLNGKPLKKPAGDASDYAKRSRITAVLPEDTWKRPCCRKEASAP